MCKANIDKVVGFLEEHLNECRLLDEWYTDVNKVLPRNRKLSARELAFAFRVIREKGLLNVEHKNGTNLYGFSAD